MIRRTVILLEKDRLLTCGRPAAYNFSAEERCRDSGLFD